MPLHLQRATPTGSHTPNSCNYLSFETYLVKQISHLQMFLDLLWGEMCCINDSFSLFASENLFIIFLNEQAKSVANTAGATLSMNFTVNTKQHSDLHANSAFGLHSTHLLLLPSI